LFFYNFICLKQPKPYNLPLKSKFTALYIIVVLLDVLFYNLDINPQFLIAKNFIPIVLLFSLLESVQYKPTRTDYFLIVNLILLSIGLNFSYFFYTQPFYLSGITVIYFFEIQIQFYLVLKKLKKISTSQTKAFTKTFVIFSLALSIIIVFFPLFPFPIQLLFFIRIFQYACFISLIYGNKKISPKISLSIWLIIFSNIFLLVDMVIFDYNLEYTFIMILFYSSKYFFIDGYLDMRKGVYRLLR
jgi:hypothetical protein